MNKDFHIKFDNFYNTDTKENKEFADKIVTARRIACQTYLDRMITELENANAKDVGLLRERLVHFRWMASKLIPIYNDKQQIEVDQRIEITWNTPDTNKIIENDIETVTELGS